MTKSITTIGMVVIGLLTAVILGIESSAVEGAVSIPATQGEAGAHIAHVNPENLKATILLLQNLKNRRSHEKQWEAARLIDDRFKSFGLSSYIQSYRFREMEWPNVVAVIPGRKTPNTVILGIAHLDSISDNADGDAPGADDNGSGVAAVLEIARILRNARLDKTLQICVFSNEEIGAHGSRYFAKKANENGMKIGAVINLDVLAYNKPKGLFLGEAIRSHVTVKRKIKSIWRMTKNFINGFLYGENVLKVVGRNADKDLVRSIGLAMRESNGLRIEEIARDDCG